ncbi:helix-turn-helix domain-containing protein [Acidimangrovimonas sediminis]|uniref:helix-turn-helix domain-containing protein n=1 Tax=Acidimangrovimonas sediminis TaxID=2056283 RepID=UPI000C80DDBD|nr:helix-turn-helix transcriptional regulator [Acidimangrovimonas sediminis]
MAGAVRSDAYAAIVEGLVGERQKAGLSQAELAKKLRKPPSFVGKYEQSERRLDVVEIWVVLVALGVEPEDFLLRYKSLMPVTLK